MENLKIKVGSESESKEVKSLLVDLGFYIDFEEVMYEYPYLFSYANSNRVTADNRHDHYVNHKNKEITIQELKDLVVLKRNDRKDANHYRSDGKEYFVNSDKTRSYYMVDDEWTLTKWDESTLKEMLKPIQKSEVKEFLEAMPNGGYRYHKDDGLMIGGDWIEIPEGAVKAYLNNSNTINFVNADDDYMNSRTDGSWVDTHRGRHEACGHVLLWQRHTQPEDLPFIDEFTPTQELASEAMEVIMKDEVNQPSHYCSHPSGIECIEITRHHDFAIGNAIKYLWRAGLKDSNDEIQDLEKSIWYIQDKINQLKGEK